jgi:hypothetical protein
MVKSACLTFLFMLPPPQLWIPGSALRLRNDGPQGNLKDDEMGTFGDDLIQAMTEALAHAKGEGDAIVHVLKTPLEVREDAKLESDADAGTQAGE